MASSAFTKETFRSITHSLGRFLAIAGIVALGAGFYAGLRMTAPDMKLAADDFYDDTDLMDIRVVSTLGLTDDDLEALRDVEGVEAVMGAYETDVLVTMGDEQYATRVHSIPAAAQTSDTSDGLHAYSDDANYLNRPILKEGAWPAREGECVLSYDLVGPRQDTKLGDIVTITEGTQDVDETLVTRRYKVVGYVSSPYYATSSTLGTTSLGTGSIKQYMYVLESDFKEGQPYSEAFLTVQGAAAEIEGSSAYDDTVAAVEDRIKAIAPDREQIRVDELKAQAQEELDKNWDEYNEQKADVEKQLDEAQQELDEAAATIASGEEQLAQAQASYNSGVAELASQRSSVEAQLAAAQSELDEAEEELDANRSTIEELEKQLPSLKEEWQAGSDELKEQIASWQAQSDEVDEALKQAEAAVEAGTPGAEALFQQLQAAREELDEAYQSQIVPAQNQLDESWTQIEQAQALIDEFNAGEEQLAQGRAELQASRQEAQSEFDAAQQELDSAAAQIASSQNELAEGRESYEEGLAEYEEQKANADEELAEAEKELNDAQQEIDDLEKGEWLVMDRSTNYGVVSFNADADRVDSIAQVFPFIFFLVAALVALTSMTRMVEEERVLIGTFKALGYRRGRIIGKYLIYAAVASGVGGIVGIALLSQVLPVTIMYAYSIIYFVPTPSFPLSIDWGIAGLSLGLGMGVTLFATAAAAWTTLREKPATLMLPRVPKAGKRIALEHITPLWRRLSFSWKVTCRNIFRYRSRLIMTLIGVAGCTALLLTGLGLSDSINDIINKQYGEIVQYNATITLDDDVAQSVAEEDETSVSGATNESTDTTNAGAATDTSGASTTNEATSTANDTAATEDAYESTAQERWVAIEDFLDSGDVSMYTTVQWSSVLGSTPSADESNGQNSTDVEGTTGATAEAEDMDVEFVVASDASTFEEFFVLRTRSGHNPVPLGDDSLLISEKLANELGISIGDSIVLTERDATGNATSTHYEATVDGIFENYVYNYAIMGPTLYENLVGSLPAYNTILADVSVTGDARDKFDEDLKELPGVKTISYNEETIDTYSEMLSSVNMIVVVLVVAAAALAFIVLYNLTNINIIERKREIATLKVLGFTSGEVNAYIFRETILLTILGCLIGLLLGIWMESFVVTSAEVTQVMFGREIHVLSFVIAFVATIVFAIIVMLAMRGKLKHIDMVESLKSNE